MVHASAADNATAGAPSRIFFVMGFIIPITSFRIAIKSRSPFGVHRASSAFKAIVLRSPARAKYSAAQMVSAQSPKRPKGKRRFGAGLLTKRSGDSLIPMKRLWVATLLVLSPTSMLYGRAHRIADT